MRLKTRKKLARIQKSFRKHIKKIQLFAAFVFFQMYSFAQNTSGIKNDSDVYKAFVKLLPYLNGLVTVLVFIAGVRGVIKILRSDPEGKTDLMYAGVGAAAYVGLSNAVLLLN